MNSAQSPLPVAANPKSKNHRKSKFGNYFGNNLQNSQIAQKKARAGTQRAARACGCPDVDRSHDLARPRRGRRRRHRHQRYLSANHRRGVGAWYKHPPSKISLSSPRATRKRSSIVAAIPLGAVTTGEAAVSSRVAPAPELSQLRTTVADLEPPAETVAPFAVAAIPNAEAKAEATAVETAPPKLAKNRKVMKTKVVRVAHHQRGYPGAYAQYGRGWDSWAGGGWSGFQPFGNNRRF
jgi:hypothetical protein